MKSERFLPSRSAAWSIRSRCSGRARKLMVASRTSESFVCTSDIQIVRDLCIDCQYAVSHPHPAAALLRRKNRVDHAHVEDRVLHAPGQGLATAHGLREGVALQRVLVAGIEVLAFDGAAVQR